MGRRATLVLTGLFLVLVSFFVEAQEVTNIATGLRVYKDTIEYEVYLHQHLEAGVFEPEHEVVVRGRDYDRASGEVTAASIEGVDCVYTGEDAFVEWEVDIERRALQHRTQTRSKDEALLSNVPSRSTARCRSKERSTCDSRGSGVTLKISSLTTRAANSVLFRKSTLPGPVTF